jgi:hypothetical protein
MDENALGFSPLAFNFQSLLQLVRVDLNLLLANRDFLIVGAFQQQHANL